MPGLARKIVVFAAIDGLVLQPLAQRGSRPGPATKIAYKDNSIGPLLNDGVESEGAGKSFEVFGVVGLLNVSKSSFLVSITRRQQVAQVKGKPIYVITEVALTPLVSKSAAETSIANTYTALQKGAIDGTAGEDESDTEGEEAASAAASDIDDDDANTPPPGSSSLGEHKRNSSVAEDVITRKGGYGRFAQKWFSKKGWNVDQRRNLGMTAETPDANPNESPSSPIEATAKGVTPTDAEMSDENNVHEQKVGEVTANLIPKLLRTTQVLFGTSRSFYFSYDYDITRSLATRRITSSELPLHTQVDPLFFWNRNLIQPFVDAGQSSFAMPLLQGFIGQRHFEMDPHPPEPVIGKEDAGRSSMQLSDLSEKLQYGTEETHGNNDSKVIAEGAGGSSPPLKPYLLTLISRRSVKRAGLRYLRRGIDDEGNTANRVETEQILSDADWNPSSKIYSFAQIRGSIPVFFSQSPYSFKPIPQLHHSDEMNYQAFSKHFKNLSNTYGSVQIATLVEKHGPEAIVGDQYEKLLNRLNESGGIDGQKIGFEWFDFHSACKGMKFENVSLLMDKLGDTLDAFGNTVEVEGKQVSRQQGVLRTNCMDCLDRTNVVQSACARRALELQLKDAGIDITLQADQTTMWFNTLWADNGDAISKQYASTAALKGDFTRTRKRDFQGALKDMGLSINRFYSGIVNDYFSQTAIDFLVGNVSYIVFEDFEVNMMSSDPGVSMQKLRQQAIELCQKLVIADDHEEMIAGWTLLTPQIPNTIKSSPFEESVLLLTDAGLYGCRFDWSTEKVSSFKRVDLRQITSIKYGTYITSTLSAAQIDEQRNVGFVVSYKAGVNDITRVNSRAVANTQSRAEAEFPFGTALSQAPSAFQNLIGRPIVPDTCVLAMKAIPTRSAVADKNSQDAPLSEIDSVKAICSEIERMILHGQVVEAGTERKGLVQAGDIITLAEARKSTGILEQLGHSLKKLVWA